MVASPLTPALRALLGSQSDVVARHQLLGLGIGENDVRRMLRRGRLTTLTTGIYVAHNGPLTQDQLDWAAVLSCWPAALSGTSALPRPVRHQIEVPGGPVHLAVGLERRVGPRPGIAIHRMAGLEQRVAWNRSPPRLRLEHAVVDVVSGLLARDQVARGFEVLCSACQTRLTTYTRVAETLATRQRVRERALLSAMLTDLADGACSVLERGYVHGVERPHGLPAAHRQHRHRADGRTTYLDNDYQPYGLIIELDGRPFHDDPRSRDRDAGRDLAHLVSTDALTARLTYGLVFGTPCETAAQVARLLSRGGWRGSMRQCSRCSGAG